MSTARIAICLALTLVALASWSCLHAQPAAAGVTNTACGVAGDESKLAEGACDVVTEPGKAVSTVKKLLTGHVGSALKSIFGGSSSSTASTALGLAAIVAWVATGAEFSLKETTKVLGDSTTPQLRTTWFSARYWRIAGIAALLTLPFLFAAAVQALIHSDMALLIRAAVGYLPLAMLAIAVAAPLTMLLLAATDQLSAGLSAAAGGIHPSWARTVGGAELATEPFLRFLIALVTTACALVLWIELAIREAAVYVIVLMLPLAFAAFVWPARRVWAIRAVELLVALILSKLAIVAVLDLGGAALDQLGHGSGGGLTAALAGTVLVLLAALAPWAVLRLVPLSEVASSAVGSLRGEARSVVGPRINAQRMAGGGVDDDTPEPVNDAEPEVSTRAAEATVQSLAAQPGASNGSRAGANGSRPTSEGAADLPEPPGDLTATPAFTGAGVAASQAHEAQPTGAGGSGGATEPLGPEEGFEGWPAMFHAENYSWNPLPLGPDGDVTSASLWPPDDAPDDDAPREEHEPLPPPQPDDGPL